MNSARHYRTHCDPRPRARLGGPARRAHDPGAMDGRRTRFRGTAGLPADGKLLISLSVAVRSRLCALSRQSRRRARPEGGGEMSARSWSALFSAPELLWRTIVQEGAMFKLKKMAQPPCPRETRHSARGSRQANYGRLLVSSGEKRSCDAFLGTRACPRSVRFSRSRRFLEQKGL